MKSKILTIGILLIMICNLYAVADNTEKIEISNNNWEQVNEDGFGRWTNRGPRGIANFNNSLIIGTIANNYPDYDIRINLTWPFFTFFKDFAEMTLNKKGVIGCEIWSYNGTSWIPLVANHGSAIMPAGFGNNNNYQIAVLIPYKGYLYAGTTNDETGCEVWRTRSINEEWEKVVDAGFGNKYNLWVMSAEIFNDELYTGTASVFGTEVYKTSDGVNWTQVVGESAKTKPGFGNLHNINTYSMEVYDSCLYIGTASRRGCELWRTADGVNWEPVIAYKNLVMAKLHGAVFPRGFGKFLIPGIRNMMVFKDELYLMTSSTYYVKFTFKAFHMMFSFNGKFRAPPIRLIKYVQSLGTKIFKYNSTTDKLTMVVGGPGTKNNSAGFGDKLNQYSWSVVVHDDYMYVGTWHPDRVNFTFKRKKLLNWDLSIGLKTGCAQIWRTSDGFNWEKITDEGFGDKYNMGVRAMQVYNNSLYAATVNIVTGCEVWKLDFN
jgi:hypothetical protein